MKIVSQKLMLALVFGLSTLTTTTLLRAQQVPSTDRQGAPMSTGEIEKVSLDSGELTIKHGPLDNLGMPGMTMIFAVAEKSMLSQVKPGSKIRFVAEMVQGTFTVTKLEVVQ